MFPGGCHARHAARTDRPVEFSPWASAFAGPIAEFAEGTENAKLELNLHVMERKRRRQATRGEGAREPSRERGERKDGHTHTHPRTQPKGS